MTENRHKRKFLKFILNQIDDISSPKILEFGVSERGLSTSIFLDLCKKNNGKLISVDNNPNSRQFGDSNWKFIQTRDDDFVSVEKEIKDHLDVIYLDTIHKADHVEKIIYRYYSKLKKGGFFFIDDISWIPYISKNPKNHFYKEINNMETFEKILDIYNANSENFDLEFSFVGTGIAKIHKLKDDKLNINNNFKSRKFSIKNLFRKIFQSLRIGNKK